MVRFANLSVLLALAAGQQVLAQGTNQPASSGTTAASTTGTQPASSGTSAARSSGTSNTGTSAASSTQTSGTTAASSTATSGTSTTNPPSSASSTGTAPPLPTLSGVLPPPLIVPDTSGAPFMQKTNLPEGTVFIAVGAILGFLALSVLLWRAVIAWSLRRSSKRAANIYAPDTKSMFGFGGSTGYKSMYNDSNMSLEQLSSANTGYLGAGAAKPSQTSGTQDRRSTKQPRATSSRAPSNLFFSPTAGPGAGTGSAQQSARASTMLPSGYYASNASSANYARAQQSPPDSPDLRPQGSHLRASSGPRHSLGASRLSTNVSGGQEQRRSRQPSGQNLGVAAPSQGRTPSAHFETLLDIHGHGPSERF